MDFYINFKLFEDKYIQKFIGYFLFGSIRKIFGYYKFLGDFFIGIQVQLSNRYRNIYFF